MSFIDLIRKDWRKGTNELFLDYRLDIKELETQKIDSKILICPRIGDEIDSPDLHIIPNVIVGDNKLLIDKLTGEIKSNQLTEIFNLLNDFSTENKQINIKLDSLQNQLDKINTALNIDVSNPTNKKITTNYNVIINGNFTN
jgi:hypothetical protein